MKKSYTHRGGSTSSLSGGHSHQQTLLGNTITQAYMLAAGSTLKAHYREGSSALNGTTTLVHNFQNDQGNSRS